MQGNRKKNNSKMSDILKKSVNELRNRSGCGKNGLYITIKSNVNKTSHRLVKNIIGQCFFSKFWNMSDYV